MLEIRNPTNGFVRLEAGPYVVLCDVWLRGGIFDGGWFPYPPLRASESHLAGATHCFISHIHEDHFDLASIASLPKNVVFMVPDQYPNALIRSKLRALGFTDIRMLPLSEPSLVSPDLTIEAIPPMNVYGQETELREQKAKESLTYHIDAGALITFRDTRIVLLSDNYPYCPEDAGASVGRMRECDLLAFPFNGTASDYPLCYENLSEDEIDAVTEAREMKRALATERFIDLVKPKALLPYSSEFAVAGPMARSFARWCATGWWMDKTAASERYASRTGLPSLVLYEGDVARMASGELSFSRGELDRPTLRAVADALYSPVPNTKRLFPAVKQASDLDSPIRQAAEHMFLAMDRHGISSEWALSLEVEEGRHWYLDLQQRSVGSSPPALERLLTCRCEAHYLAALLRGDSHWNNARISFNLRWKRVPDVYDHGLYDALNFLHLPRPNTA